MGLTTLDRVILAIEHQEGFHKAGSRAQRNNNPGNLKMGTFARRWGARSMDDEHHAIFPTLDMGRRALRSLLQTKFRGHTLRQIGPRYAEDPNWAASVSKIAGVSLDTPIG